MSFLVQAAISLLALAVIGYIVVLLWQRLLMEIDKRTSLIESTEIRQLHTDIRQLREQQPQQADTGQLKTALDSLKAELQAAQTQITQLREQNEALRQITQRLDDKRPETIDTRFSEEEFARFIGSREDIQRILREKLGIEALQRLIMEKIPNQFTAADLDGQLRKNADAYWAIFQADEKYLKSLKSGIAESINMPKSKTTKK